MFLRVRSASPQVSGGFFLEPSSYILGLTIPLGSVWLLHHFYVPDTCRSYYMFSPPSRTNLLCDVSIFSISCYECLRSTLRDARINIQTEIVNGERIFFFNGFPRGHYLVWWVRVSLGVKHAVFCLGFFCRARRPAPFS